ncbi:esterase-like activity of phytase family protein, partial [Corynebacterium variabile]|uniref:esterase-like activity of phytase family protein n=1 Tax=Corynebacterium variabile TaxID=1727 RepID=UPI00373628AE
SSNASASTETSRDAGLVWTAEGTPTVTVADRHGRATGTLPVAEGIRRNQGLEGLAVTDAGTGTADGQRIITATEAAPDNHDHPVISVYDGTATTRYNWPGTGISEILADPTDATGLLVLERGYTGGRGNSSMIWRTTLPGTGGAGTGVLKRELVADLGALIGHSDVGNTEAMAWAPGRHPGTTDELPELLIATDDNFSDGQRGVLHRVRVR